MTLNLALFDLDNTLLAGDSDFEWGQFLTRKGIVDKEVFEARNVAFYEQYKAGTLDIYEFLDFQLQPLVRHTRAELDAWHAEFMESTVRPMMTPKAQALVNEHLAAGDIVAVVMYTSFSRFDCCMHLATARKDWANKEFLHKAFSYPFIDMALERVTFATDSSNEAAIRLHKKLGAKYEGTLRRFHGFRDMVIHGMLKDECKFLEEKKWVDC